MTGVAVEFRNGLIRLNNIAGDAVGFADAVPLSRRRKHEGQMWWEASTADAEAVVEWADTKGLSVDDEVRRYAEGHWKRELAHVSAATAAEAPSSTPEVIGLTATLLGTQAAVVAAAPNAWFSPPGQSKIRHRAVLLSDDQGLGKTLTALSVLRIAAGPAQRAVIVCPSGLTMNWLGETSEHFTDSTFTGWIATGKTPTPIPEGTDTVVIGWEILPDWTEALLAWAPDALIGDEGHYAKSGKLQKRTTTEPVNDEDGKPVYGADGKRLTEKVTKIVGGSARAHAILELGKSVAARHGLIMPMTGTPIVNRPLEMWALIKLCGFEKLFVSEHEFKERYCGPRWQKVSGGRTVRTYGGASNLIELNTRLVTSGVYFRRTKQVLVDQGLLKPKYVDKVYCYDYAATPRPWTIRPTTEEWAEYEQAQGETRDFFRARAEEIAAERRTGVDTQLVRKKVAAEGAKHLKKITELRQTVARLKVPHVIEQAQKLVDRGEKVVIAAHHRDVVTAYANAFTGLRIQGSMGARAIEEAKALFNGTPVTEHPVLVLSVEAGKTGHTLCKQSLEGAGKACAYMIFAEQVWTPGDESQAQDRIWRIGQDREVHIANALFGSSVDQSIYRQRLKKKYVFNAAIDAIDQESLEAAKSDRSGAGQLAAELVYGASQ